MKATTVIIAEPELQAFRRQLRRLHLVETCSAPVTIRDGYRPRVDGYAISFVPQPRRAS